MTDTNEQPREPQEGEPNASPEGSSPDESRKIDTDGPIVARAGSWYRNARYILVVGLIAVAAWCAYDGFYLWPKQNEQYIALDTEIRQLQSTADRTPDQEKRLADAIIELRDLGEPHLVRIPDTQNEYDPNRPNLSLRLMTWLTFIFPVMSVGLLVWTLYNSRGEYRLEKRTVYAPGHEPVPLDRFGALDDSKWRKKGVAYATYSTESGSEGVLKLDDFVYQAAPIRDIHDAIYQEIYGDLPDDTSAGSQSEADASRTDEAETTDTTGDPSGEEGDTTGEEGDSTRST